MARWFVDCFDEDDDWYVAEAPWGIFLSTEGFCPPIRCSFPTEADAASFMEAELSPDA
jgi:hypothetical protein